jgi:hypothetical protein
MMIHANMSKFDLSSLVKADVAGEALNPEVYERFLEKTGVKLREGFGQTETSVLLFTNQWIEPKPGSMGKPAAGWNIQLLDERGRQITDVNTVGEICVCVKDSKPLGLFQGYHKNEKQTASVYRDGFYHTGDQATMDEDGYLWYVGRIDDVIKSSGYRIGPFEIESVIMELPYVLECAITPVPDEVRGQIVKATIVLVKGTEGTDELKKEIRDVIIFYQRPLKSQKGLLSICELEGREVEIEKNGKTVTKTIGPRVTPKSSPIFQESKIWQILNNVQVIGEQIQGKKRPLTQEEKQTLFSELNIKEKLTETQTLQILEMKGEYKLNYKELDGNRTRATFNKAFQEIIELSGHEIDLAKKNARDIEAEFRELFAALEFNTEILTFTTDLTKEEIKNQQIEKQAYYKLWHLLYSFEGDNSKLGNEKLIQKLMELCKMPLEYASILANVTFALDCDSSGSTTCSDSVTSTGVGISIVTNGSFIISSAFFCFLEISP